MEKPILFNTEDVRAILDGRKTVTRRVIKQPAVWNIIEDDGGRCTGSVYDDGNGITIYPTVDDCRYQYGDTLWVRETWDVGGSGLTHWYIYKADHETFCGGTKSSERGLRWRPSIHMPREAARIFLRVTDVSVERLQDITYDGIKAEGVYDDYETTSEKYHENLARMAYPKAFAELWDSAVKPADRDRYGWDANPWVWAIEFERIEND